MSFGLLTTMERESMHAQILKTSDPEWGRALRTMPHDFYSLPSYVRLAAQFEGGEGVAILVEHGERRLLLPLLLRDIPGDLGNRDVRDAVSPYGYPGIGLTSVDPGGPAANAFLDEAMVAAIALLRQRGVVSLFIRLNPMLPVDAGVLARHGVVVDHGHTVSINLMEDRERIFSDLRKDHAKNLRRLDRLGFTTSFDDSGDPAAIAAFVDVYTETMDRLDASATYYFDTAYVTDLVSALDGRVVIAVVRQGEEVAAAGIFTEVGTVFQHHLVGTRTAFFPVAPSKMIIRDAALWAKGRGHGTMHLGGGLGGAEDALFNFKAGFSAGRQLFQTTRIVIDRPAYDELVAGWEARVGRPAGDLTGFFPAYRAATDTSHRLRGVVRPDVDHRRAG